MRLAVRCAAAALALAASAAQGQPAPSVAGVWFGLRADGMTGKVKVDHYTFLADGRAFRGDPFEGLGRQVDWTLACRYHECGTYRQTGGEVIFTRSADYSTAFTIDGGGVLRNPKAKISYRRMHPIEGPLSGAWGVYDPAGGPPMMTVSFEPGGRFHESGLLRYTAWSALAPDGEDRASKAVDHGAGTYSVRRGTLELRYDTGTVARFFLATPPSVAPGPSPSSLQLGGAMLARAP